MCVKEIKKYIKKIAKNSPVRTYGRSYQLSICTLVLTSLYTTQSQQRQSCLSFNLALNR